MPSRSQLHKAHWQGVDSAGRGWGRGAGFRAPLDGSGLARVSSWLRVDAENDALATASFHIRGISRAGHAGADAVAGREAFQRVFTLPVAGRSRAEIFADVRARLVADAIGFTVVVDPGDPWRLLITHPDALLEIGSP